MNYGLMMVYVVKNATISPNDLFESDNVAK